MQTRPLGNNDLKHPPIGFGVWAVETIPQEFVATSN
jgi:aryl-alcohol dehydrogenase-like predicted oxidoreductase